MNYKEIKYEEFSPLEMLIKMAENCWKHCYCTFLADSIAQTTFSERLKADNMRVKQQLADVQQRALHDKVCASPPVNLLILKKTS